MLLPQNKIDLVLCNRICAISKSQRDPGGGGDKINSKMLYELSIAYMKDLSK